MHNYLPHERAYPLLHFVERFLLARLAHAIIVHCEHGRYLVWRKLLRRSNVFIVPLGDFGPYLSRLPDRQRAREQLQIADNWIVFYFFGSIRPYKQVPQLVREFQAVPGVNLRLVITGIPLNETLKIETMDLAVLDSRVQTRLEYISDKDLSTYLAAADVAIFPYRDILGSGSVMLALSSGLSVVAPRIGCLEELITPACGVLYKPGTGALAQAIQQIIASDLLEMGRAARARARQFPWQTMVQETARIYRGDSVYA
jgi:glycosyltransferase involved in cell wall biosynthesis